jgi:hypothetical protein
MIPQMESPKVNLAGYIPHLIHYLYTTLVMHEQ